MHSGVQQIALAAKPLIHVRRGVYTIIRNLSSRRFEIWQKEIVCRFEIIKCVEVEWGICRLSRSVYIVGA